MNAIKMQQLYQAISTWLTAHRNTLEDESVTIRFNTKRPWKISIVTGPTEEDRNIIARALQRMPQMSRTRMSRFLEGKKCDSLSKLRTIPRDEFRVSNLASKSLSAFALALRSEGADYHVLDEFCVKAERMRITIRKLTARDWDKIARVPWTPEQRAAIIALQANDNERQVAIHALGLKFASTMAMQVGRINSINNAFRRSGMNYRLKLIIVHRMPGLADEFVQIGVLKK